MTQKIPFFKFHGTCRFGNLKIFQLGQDVTPLSKTPWHLPSVPATVRNARVLCKRVAIWRSQQMPWAKNCFELEILSFLPGIFDVFAKCNKKCSHAYAHLYIYTLYMCICHSATLFKKTSLPLSFYPTGWALFDCSATSVWHTHWMGAFIKTTTLGIRCSMRHLHP